MALPGTPTRRSTSRRRLRDLRLVNLSYKMDEGIQSFVEHINISGNSRTKDKVIRREIVLSPGDVFDTVRVDISKKRLEGLQYFERVDTYASDTGVPGRKDLNVVVQEKRTGNLNFGLGFSTTDGLLGFGELSQGNFDIMNWKTFTGAGQKFQGESSARYPDEECFNGARPNRIFSINGWQLGGRLFFDEYNYYSNVYDQRDYGFDIFMRKPITNFLSSEARLHDSGDRHLQHQERKRLLRRCWTLIDARRSVQPGEPSDY